MAKDSLGRLKKRAVTEEEAATRYNYQKADYRNYLDGDLTSRVDFEAADELTKGPTSTGEMYSREENDWSSLVTDKVRVYKGGSWRDRVYWLNPATRRFLDQEEARDDLGFRCAMTEVSSPGGKGFGK